MQPVFLDEASCLHIDSYTYKFCGFLHGFISLASNSTVTANLDFQSSENVFPGAGCLAKNIPKEFQELLFSVATFADVCTHPPSCRKTDKNRPKLLYRPCGQHLKPTGLRSRAEARVTGRAAKAGGGGKFKPSVSFTHGCFSGHGTEPLLPLPAGLQGFVLAAPAVLGQGMSPSRHLGRRGIHRTGQRW